MQIVETMSASNGKEIAADADTVPQGQVGQAIGGSCLGGVIGGLLGVLIGGFLGGLPLFFSRPMDAEFSQLLDTLSGFVYLFIGSIGGGLVGAVGLHLLSQQSLWGICLYQTGIQSNKLL